MLEGVDKLLYALDLVDAKEGSSDLLTDPETGDLKERRLFQ